MVWRRCYAVSAIVMEKWTQDINQKRIFGLHPNIFLLGLVSFFTDVSSEMIFTLLPLFLANVLGAVPVIIGFIKGVARVFVADLVLENFRGIAYGWFHSVVGISLLPASLIAGWLWQTFNPAAPFYFGAGMSLVAMIGLLMLTRE